jgi:hypothetical protein
LFEGASLTRTPSFPSLLLVSVAFALVQPLYANTATDWNAFALDTLSASKMDLLQLERAMAIEQLAVYEAANATHPLYVRSAIAIPDAPGASTEAAITEAAYRTLIALAPTTSSAASAEHATRLASIPDSPQKTAGIATGAAASATVLKWRENDGADFSTAYTPGTGPGAYQLTSARTMAGPHAFNMKPFSFASYSAFRPPPPPPLDSLQMRRDLEELLTYGGKDSTLRTPDQTEFALFHAQPGVYGWSSIARQTAAHLSLNEVETAHLLAVVEATIVDSHFAVWEAKYTYNLWRPVTALHAGAGPLNLTPAPNWTPLIPTPMIPEYPCAHCGLGAAVQIVLEGFAGTGPIDLTVKSEQITRRYHSFRQFAEEESLSRIYAGVHYRWSNYVGESIGHQVGAAELEAAPKPASASGSALK